MRIVRSISFILMLCLPVFAAAAPLAKAPARWTLRYQPTRVVNGAPVLFRVTTPKRALSLRAKWLDHEISFTFDAVQKAWVGFAGISLETKPGSYPIELQAETSSGPALTYKQGIRVQRQRYPKVIVLRVPSRYT